ncbi:MAG TPA: FlgD immunoglobulin-like domain containing protein, partial [Candidatus Kapabacteria bacterium]|nr:FlgD immunoglobulin-like domain containing protein [Candidatus Kapabacteria bacterium]
VPDGNFSGISNKGLNLFGYARGGTGTISAYNGDYDEITYGTGELAGSGAGQFAVRFTLLSADTLKGYHAFFAAMNSSPDPISFAIYTGTNKPEVMVPGTETYKLRGWGYNNEWPVYNKYTLYLLEEPVILDAGTYWVAVGQLRGTGIELGASKTRMGMRTTSVYKPEPLGSTSELGQQGYHLLIDKKFRDKNSDGELVNKNLFAWENSRGSGVWNIFTPTVGNPGYAHLDHYGFSPIDYSTATLSRGSWIPMLRPYFGKNLNYVKNPEYNPCLDDIIPVTLVQFNGIARKQGIEVYWETSSEVNNAGFQVEKNVLANEDNKDWKNIGFVKGAGNSNSTNYYNFIDKDVKANTTYQYRLRQVDKDGVISCENYSKIITLKYNDTNDGIVLEQNQPNPFSNTTNIKFNTNDNKQVVLEVLDIYGNVLKSLVNSELQSGNHNYIWDGTNSRGELVTSGTYIYRLKVGDEVLTGKMSFVR